jgi:hypothetical protein
MDLKEIEVNEALFDEIQQNCDSIDLFLVNTKDDRVSIHDDGAVYIDTVWLLSSEQFQEIARIHAEIMKGASQ